MFIQHLSATNDVNGNPRRVYAVYSATGVILDVIDEGYEGKGKYRNADLIELPAVVITPAEYREWLARVEHFNGRWEVIDAEDGFVWHRFYSRPRALKYRRAHYKPEALTIREAMAETTP